jgi:hypothetical protein
MSGHLEILPGFPPDVLAVAAHGRIDGKSYDETLVPALEAVIEKEGKAKLFYLLGEDFERFTAGAAWDDARLGVLHLHDFARIAVVTDTSWIRGAVSVFGPLVRAPIKAFHLVERATAESWIARNDPPETGYNVDATGRVTTPRS